MKNTENCKQTRIIKATYSCDNYADIYVGDCDKVLRKVAHNSTLEAVSFQAKATCEEYLYFVCWSDNKGLNGLLAELHGANTILSGTHLKWEVFPTGINFSSHLTRPSEKLINTALKKAHCKKWKAVTEGPNNDGSHFREYKEIEEKAHFIWFDSGKDSRTNVPFRGFNHNEFLIFRFPVKELFKEECRDCSNECLCIDDCCCSVCEEVITEERKVLKAQALSKSFVIKGKENNSKRCKAPYTGETCSTLDLPTLEPCFYIHWGDSTKDQMETHDDEVLYITACNPYGNLRFRGLTITNISIVYKRKTRAIVAEKDGIATNLGNTTSTPVHTIPATTIVTVPVNDGSIQIVPNRLIQLGDVCGCSCVSQAVYLSIQNAKPQDYEIHIEYCIDQIEINQDNKGKTLFPISLIKS